jgi:signal transduction histidine kinase
VLRDDWVKMVHPLDGPLVSEARRQYVEGEVPEYKLEYRIVIPSGEEYWVASTGKGIAWSEGGAVTRMVGTMMDITERKRAERNLEDAFSVISSSINYASRIQRSVLPDETMLSSIVQDCFRGCTR